MFKSSSKFTIQIVSFLALHMHRTSLLYYGPQFVGENNISLKSNGDGL
jgi:hypothetical protein